MNKKELRAVMVRYGDKNEDLANALGLCTSSLSEKINGKRSFTQIEIGIIITRYSLTAEDVIRIFFASPVS